MEAPRALDWRGAGASKRLEVALNVRRVPFNAIIHALNVFCRCRRSANWPQPPEDTTMVLQLRCTPAE